MPSIYSKLIPLFFGKNLILKRKSNNNIFISLMKDLFVPCQFSEAFISFKINWPIQLEPYCGSHITLTR